MATELRTGGRTVVTADQAGSRAAWGIFTRFLILHVLIVVIFPVLVFQQEDIFVAVASTDALVLGIVSLLWVAKRFELPDETRPAFKKASRRAYAAMLLLLIITWALGFLGFLPGFPTPGFMG